MKRSLRILLLSPILLTGMSCGGKSSNMNKVDVVIISGQSNAVGCTHSEYVFDSMGEEKGREYSNGYPEIQIAFESWTVTDSVSIPFGLQNESSMHDFVQVELGQGNGVMTFGPEIGIAEATHSKHANKLFLIKYACGGSNLRDHWTHRDSPMYQPFIDYVKHQIQNLKGRGYSPTIKAFCWMQGEGDSYEPKYYDVYQDNLREFVGNVRTDLKKFANNKDIPFIDAGISKASVWPHPEKVNEAKVLFSRESENNFFIDTIEAGLHTNREPEGEADLFHYDSESEIKLGHLFAEAFEQFLDK